MFYFHRQTFVESLANETIQLIIIFILVLFISYLTIYNAKRRKYPPGPIGLPIVGYVPFLGGEPPKALAALGKKYGNIFSLYMGTKYTVVLNDYQSMKEGLSHPAALNRAPEIFNHVLGGVGFEELNGPLWQEQRRFSMQLMGELGFGKGGWEVLIHEEIASFVEELELLDGKAVDGAPMLSTSVSNNVISLLIGRRLDTKKEKNAVELFYDFANVSFKYMGPSDPASLVPGFRKFMEFLRISGYDRVPKIMKNVSAFLRKEIDHHKKNKRSEESPNFINYYLDELKAVNALKEKRHNAFSEYMLQGNINILFLAGSDTIYNSLCFLVRLMAAHPAIQKKIHDELDSSIGRTGKAVYGERNKTPYTFAVIMEMERFASIMPLSTTRLVGKDFELGGYVIPKGAEIFGNAWAVHNDPNYWPEPEKFVPERFLSEDGTKLLKLPSYVPFSVVERYVRSRGKIRTVSAAKCVRDWSFSQPSPINFLGKRICPGENVAWMEIYLYFTSIMQKFDICAPEGEEMDFKVINGLVVQLKPQKLKFIRRT